MNDINKILNGPDYFKCDLFNSRLRKDICIERQEGNHSVAETYKTSTIGLSFEACKTCGQGKQIRDEILKDKPKPRRGKGERKTECAFYNDCLDRTSKRDWKTFNCESCDYYDSGQEVVTKKEGTKKICEECGERETITPNHKLCSNCMQKRAQAARGKKKVSHQKLIDKGYLDKGQHKNTRRCKCGNITIGPNSPCCSECMNAAKKVKKDKKTNGHDKAVKSLSGSDSTIVIEFEQYVDILREVEMLAEKEMRPINYQIVWMLKEALKSRQN